ncbi:MAG: Na+/H+ antiporter subunit C [Planctomycetes bacterium]|jgi:multicomponent Na+:H+ antiporter subunit C|nr:Na+/H+ antiporter subunit C [Planctomycetota bacterium]HJM57524.1 cation:proton antiporter subunit C [Planctomycetota bacterium]
MEALGIWNYWVVVLLMMIGLYAVIARDHLVKKLIGLGMFQVAVIMFYVSMGKVTGGTAPIIPEDVPAEGVLYSNPLPHVLMLTAIVVGVATLAVGLALVVRIREAYGTVEEDELQRMNGAGS